MVSFKDYRGKIVQEGTKVAYNQSGEVVIGTVQSLVIIPRDNRWNPFEYIIMIRKYANTTDWTEHATISIVRNHLCVVSIEE